MSTKLDLEGLNNTRDLGGMKGYGGKRIVPGKLIRSGNLYEATDRDMGFLRSGVEMIVDFRSAREQTERPDPVLEGIDYLSLPVFEERAKGVTRDQGSDRDFFSLIAEDREMAERSMTDTYVRFVTSEHCLGQYRRFLEALLCRREKAVLWHCTAGKDRAGFASVLVQEILGVSREDIMEDYLQTNKNIAGEVERLVRMASVRAGGMDKTAEDSLRYFFGAHEEFLNAVYDEILRRYGGTDSFLRAGLGIGEEKVKEYRRIYLEDPSEA